MLEELIQVSEAESYWTLQAQMISENVASRSLHLSCGFREVGYRERYGQVNGIWHDVVLLERRSVKTGGPGLPTRSCLQVT